MATLATLDFEYLLVNYPLYSQSELKDPLVLSKFFDAFGSASWFITEYDPEQKLAFGYVKGLSPGCDEFGYISLDELESIIHPTLKVPRIERDLYFTPEKMSIILKTSD